MEGLITLLLSLFIAMSFASGNNVTEMPPAPPPVPEPVPINLRVMSFNIHAGKEAGPDLEGVATLIRKSGADIVGLQEVDKHMSRSGGQDQAAVLAEKLGMFYAYGPNLSLPQLSFDNPVGYYGNAILSTYPIVESRNIRLERQGTWENRGLLQATIDVEGNPVYFYVTHLGLAEGERIAHVEQILDAAGREGVKILAGDFNSRPHSPVIAKLREFFVDSSQVTGAMDPTFRSEKWVGKIDYVFADKNVEVVGGQVLSTGASDHNPVIADLRFYVNEVK